MMKCPVCNHATDTRGGVRHHEPGSGRCWNNLNVASISLKLALDIIKRFMPYFEAVTSRHNGYDSAARAELGIEEPETPQQAIQDLLDEERSLAEIEMRMKIEEALKDG